MLESRPYWTVLCDRCGLDAFKDGEFTAYSDSTTALDTVSEWNEWLSTEDGKHYCGDCVEWDEDRDELVVKAEAG